MSNIEIPFLDLVTPHLQMEEELVSIFRTALQSAAFVGGKAVAEFEAAFAKFCEAAFCVGVSSGTDALRFALIAAGVRCGDSVLTVPNSFIATAEAISQAGAQPEFVDINEQTHSMDPECLREFLETKCDQDQRTGTPISRRTGRRITAVVPVDLYGQTANMDPILELAESWNLLVVEDACQAHGAEYFSRTEKCWRKAGSIGTAAAFSFYPGKNLGACGEGGAVTTNDPDLAQRIRMLRDHGQVKKYYHDIEGYNGRLDAIQAEILHAKLKRLPEWNRKRREKAAIYRELLHDVDGVVMPQEPSWAKPVYHLFVIRTRDREALTIALTQAGVGTGIHYPIPIHLQKAYQSLGYRQGDLPIAEQDAREVLSLPMYPELRPDQQSYIAREIKKFLSAQTKCEDRVFVQAGSAV